jgi:very-short-patch-repair endonuclease
MWAEAERPALQAMNVFERLYDLRGRIDRESEGVELMLGDGRLRWQQVDGAVDHPVLLQRVDLEFDPSVPEFRVLDADRGPELYTALLLGGGTISAAQLNQLRVELEQGGYHPLARQATSAYLRRLVQLLGPRGTFYETAGNAPVGPDPVVQRDPVLFLRTRGGGYAAAFDRVLQDLESRIDLPAALTRLVGVEPPAPPDPIESATSPWGEPPDVLLSKPANMEQVQIARALDRHRAVLVQGPPGTGKSHTIANLIGHLVAHGKRVLVTSHTTKALRVLRGHVVEALQPLCVAMLDNDLEGRMQMEQAVRGILSRLTESNEETLGREVGQLAEARAALNNEIAGITGNLRAAREAEYLPIVIAGEAVDPAQGARWIREHADGNDWVLAPAEQGAPLPLPEIELRELYATNLELTAAEDDEIAAGLPNLEAIPDPDTFGARVADLQIAERSDFAAFWRSAVGEDEISALEHLTDMVCAAVADLDRLEPWQLSIVAAGHSSGPDEEMWLELARQVNIALDGWKKSRPSLLEHNVEISAAFQRDGATRTVAEIIDYIGNGGQLGGWILFRRPRWKDLIASSRVNGRPPEQDGHFRAIWAYLAVDDGRKRLAARWERQAQPIGLPAFSATGSNPEPMLTEYTAQFSGLLAWWPTRWRGIEGAAGAAGFRWTEFRHREVARAAPATPFDRDVSILKGPMQEAVTNRIAIARRSRAERVLRDLHALLLRHTGRVCGGLREAARVLAPNSYQLAWKSLQRLVQKQSLSQRRRHLLGQLAEVAPVWAAAIQHRRSIHGAAEVPGDPEVAWKWRQLQQEIARRADLGEVELTRILHQRRSSLREVTAKLIDRRAWLGQLRRTDLNARQALQGWADTQRRIGKGTGKRAPALQAEARRLLAKARDAVPVWIMPLSRVAESFDATGGRFDVVIVDEASQSDMTGLLAWYLGDRVAVVGDHEQVSPMAIGQEIGAMNALIAQHLQEIPNSHLYDGMTSVYDLAQQSFGGTIALREHFRCVPDIIEFSNELAYNLEIRPLRDPSSAPRPHVVEYMVQPVPGVERSGKTNLAEARSIVALVKAMTEMPEYTGKTIGAITLLGDEQAGLIQDLAVRAIGAVELDARRFVAGNSAQYQGDERHIVFLSMVDTPTGDALSLRQTGAFKQRYNVAASRAKDQLWLVHSLDPNRDLKAGDLRRRLIEYVRDPGARRRSAEQAALRAESPFEKAVIERLVTAGYRVEPQVWVGRYRIDMIVSGGGKDVALECDGDRYHGIDQIPEDMARQAILERAGWRFVRIRGTRFYRNPSATMDWVVNELGRLGVEPVGSAPSAGAMEAQAAEFRARVVRRAWQFMRGQGWLADPTTDLPPLAS